MRSCIRTREEWIRCARCAAAPWGRDGVFLGFFRRLRRPLSALVSRTGMPPRALSSPASSAGRADSLGLNRALFFPSSCLPSNPYGPCWSLPPLPFLPPLLFLISPSLTELPGSGLLWLLAHASMAIVYIFVVTYTDSFPESASSTSRFRRRSHVAAPSTEERRAWDVMSVVTRATSLGDRRAEGSAGERTRWVVRSSHWSKFDVPCCHCPPPMLVSSLFLLLSSDGKPASVVAD